MNYKIQKLSLNEFHLLLPLMKDCFGVTVNVSYFDWKYLNNPAGSFEGFIAVADNGEIAAYYGVIPEKYLIDKKETIIYQSCDTMTHSKHRGKGLFKKLALYCYEILKLENKLFVIGFGGEQSTSGFLKFGWMHIFDIRQYFYPKLFSYGYLKAPNKRITEISDFKLIEAAVLKSNAHAEIHSYKCLETFAWRLKNPIRVYKILAIKDESLDIFNSYLCYYIDEDKIILFDFYFKTKSEGQQLMGVLKILLRKNKFRGIVAFCKEKSAYSAMLNSLKFIVNPLSKGPLSRKTPFIFYALPEIIQRFKDPKKWEINSFDHDAL